tara:strand:+ start:970 stop:1362 length:393 start_codon:yes stop_codon:yes gene_type:complete
MLEQIANFIIAAILGIMVFFSFVVAPVTFTALNEENSRKFIRKIFPFYYNVNFVLCVLVTIIYLFLKIFNINFYLVLFVTILFFISNYILMPLINKYRDNNQDKKFKYLHSISVVINFAQIIILIFLLIY